MPLEVTIERIKWDWICHFEELIWERGMTDKNVVNDAIQMRNGTGKTTTLNLIQRLVSNQTLEFDDTIDMKDPAVKRTPQGQINNLLSASRYSGLAAKKHIKRAEVGKPKFSLTLDVNGKKFTLIYVFSGDNGYAHLKAEIHTQTPNGMIHPDGKTSGYSMPVDFKSTFEANQEFAELVFIDAQDMGDNANRLGKEAMDNILRKMSDITPLQYARQHRIDDLIAARAKKAERKGTQQEKESGEAALKSVNATIRKLKEKLQNDISERDTLKGKIQRWSEAIENAQEESDLSLEFEKKKGELREAEKNVKIKTDSLRNALLNPINLPNSAWAPVVDYYSRLSSKRIPRTIAKEYLSTIMNEEVCICGRDLDEHGKECITQRMKDSMGLSILSEVYIMKDRVADIEKSENIEKIKKSLERAVLKRDKLESEVSGLNSRLSTAGGESVADLTAKLTTAKNDVKTLEDNIEMYSCTDNATIVINKATWLGKSRKYNGKPSEARGDIRDCKNIHYAENQIKKNLTKKVSAIAGIADLFEAGNALSKVLQHVEERILEKLSSELLVRVNHHMDNFNMQDEFEIISLENGVEAEMPDGTPKLGYSTGEEMSVVICIVEAISSLTSTKLPLIVDNPTKGLGGDKGAGMRELYKRIDGQVLFFMYDTEKDVKGFRGYFDSSFVNPSTFMREFESPGQKSKEVNQGKFIVKYDWETWNSYDTSGEEDNHTVEVGQ